MNLYKKVGSLEHILRSKTECTERMLTKKEPAYFEASNTSA